MLTEETIVKNWDTFLSLHKKYLPTRADKCIEMYSKFGEENSMIAPASSKVMFHNAFAGGYIDHVIRVTRFSVDVYKLYKSWGLEVDNFSMEELIFSALCHDLGKLGYPTGNDPHYVPNLSEWHVINKGAVYEKNKDIPKMGISDRSLFTLQHFGIPVSINEYIAIKTHDGLYEEGNKQYIINYDIYENYRTNLPKILHHADLMASKYEQERYIKSKPEISNTFFKKIEL